jgi:protein-tyrosine phosphatase
MQNYRRLPLEGLCNARDLGGYPTENGGVTRYGAFVRCEAPCELTEGDLAFLREYGLTTVVDFRGDEEVARRRSALEGLPWVDYRRSPTFNGQVAFGARAGDAGPPVTAFVRWGEKYVEMADDCRDWVARTLTLLAGARGAAMFNCTTGKDRTGIISALLLSLAGVRGEDIVADYCVSEVYLARVYEPLLREYNLRFPGEGGAELTNPFFKTSPVNMSVLLAHLETAYGGGEAYVRACGAPEGAIETLRAKLV